MISCTLFLLNVMLVSPRLTERFEDAHVYILPVGLGPFCALFRSFPLLLVARPASVAPPPVVALGNVDTDVHSVMTCHNIKQRASRSDDKHGRENKSL